MAVRGSKVQRAPKYATANYVHCHCQNEDLLEVSVGPDPVLADVLCCVSMLQRLIYNVDVLSLDCHK